MISGATIAVVIVALAISHGPEYIFATVVLAGIIHFSGFIQVRKADAHSSTSVIYGFVNGLAIIILCHN
jgi:SulP family sulfate permease